LVRAYAEPTRHSAALRVLLYRSWLAPFAVLFCYVLVWALPPGAKPEEPSAFSQLILVVGIVLHILLLSSMRASARLACGIGALLSFVVVAVSLIVFLFVQVFEAKLLGLLL
ncbi:MAG: hypothetical protein RL701_826, partial [Pseudomonadota bacterium]